MLTRTSLAFSLTLFFSIWSSTIDAADVAHSNAPCIVDAFLRAHEKTMQAHAEETSVDAVLELLETNFVYEHPRVGIKIEGAENYRKGLTAFLGASDRGRYEVMEYMSNGDTVTISMNRKFRVERDGEWQEQSVEQMTVFEIRDEKISRMIDYW